jgi:CubicO group peptidase (beta-lactamase class C family)
MPEPLDHLFIAGFAEARPFKKSTLSVLRTPGPQRVRESHGQRLVQRLIVTLFTAVLSASTFAARGTQDLLALQLRQGLVPPVMVAGETPALKSLEARMAELKVPGVSVAVFRDGRIEFARGFGVTRMGGPPVTADTLFQAASISKPVFALAVLHLVDEGKLALDADVNDYLKEWKLPENDFTRQAKVTLRGLLTHSAGLTVHGFPGYESKAKLPSIAQILDGVPPANTSPIRVDILPGSQQRYSGGGYTLAQQVLSDVTGVPLAKLLHDSVLAPLGMTLSTYEQPLPAKRLAEVAMPYRGDGTPVDGGPHAYPEIAAAGLWTTPTDLAHYALGVRAALDGISKVVSAKTARAMLTPVINNQGLGPQLGGSTARKFFMHNGGNEGYRCQLVAYEDGAGAVVMTNGDNGGELLVEVMRTIAHVYQWPDFAPPVRTVTAVKPGSLERLLGVFTLNEGSTYVVRKDGDRVVGNVFRNTPVELLPAGDLELFARDVDLVVNFTLDENGTATAVKHRLNGWERTGTRVDDAQARKTLAAITHAEQRFKDQKPRAGGEAAVRKLFTDIANGNPDYSSMGPRLAEITRQQLPGLQPFVAGLGTLKTARFQRVGVDGSDEYHADFEKGGLRVDLWLNDDGRIDDVGVVPR